MQSQDREPDVAQPDAPARAPAAYPPDTPWPAFGAAAAVVLIIASGVTIALGAAAARLVVGIAGLLVMQLVWSAAVLWVADWYGGHRRQLLALAHVPPPWAWAYGLGILLAVLVPYNLAIWMLSPETLTRDLLPFAKLARSDEAWVALLAVGIGAPVSEELLFRGFLLPALAKVRQIGFWGAALITTAGWTLLHFSYSALGLAEVFTIGLVFCWLLRRFGSLWLVIGLHGLYNSVQMIALMLIPL